VVLRDAAELFSSFGYGRYSAHQSVRWRRRNTVGSGTAPLATAGVTFELTADVTVDDPLAVPGSTGNQRFLLDLPELRTADLDECLAALRDYTARLCAHTSALDDPDVPRTGEHPSTVNASD